MFDFDEIVDRSGTNSIKWDIKEGELPMWVADMDFKTAPPVIDALKKRVDHGIFGYSDYTEEWKDAYVGWWKRRHDFEMDKDALIFSTGAIPAISSIVRKLTTPAEKVVLLTPVYNIFFNSVVNNGRFPVECPLKYVENSDANNCINNCSESSNDKAADDKNSSDKEVCADGHFEIDWENFEKVCSDPQVSLLIFCNPHNPTGTVWDKESLARVGEICCRNHVRVISDEVHCDLVCPTGHYIPFASVNEVNKKISITCLAPSKSFNIAGLAGAAVYVHDEDIRHKVWRGINTDEVGEPNAFAVQAAIAAYNYGEEWLDELRKYIAINKDLTKTFIQNEIPHLKYVSGPATDLCWVDARSFGKGNEKFTDFLRRTTGLWISDGAAYGKAGEGFLRINVAAPKCNVEDGLERLKKGVELYTR